MKILILDIETAPNLVHVWGLWQQNVGLPQIIDAGYVLCVAAKWYGEKEVFFYSVQKNGEHGMLKAVHAMLEQADAVVHYNGTKFDIPTLNKEFLLNGLTPPAPYKQIDLLRTSRGQFRFASNKLDYVAQALELGRKTKHRGHQLWIDCMANDPAAWKEMEEYNKNDVIILEAVYEAFKPWIKGHANHSVFSGDLLCPTCGGNHYHRRGVQVTVAGKYPRYQCVDCGTWFRGNKSEIRNKEKFLGIV